MEAVNHPLSLVTSLQIPAQKLCDFCRMEVGETLTSPENNRECVRITVRYARLEGNLVRNKYLDIQRRGEGGRKTWALFKYHIERRSTYDTSGKGLAYMEKKIIVANKSFVQDFHPRMGYDDLVGIR